MISPSSRRNEPATEPSASFSRSTLKCQGWEFQKRIGQSGGSRARNAVTVFRPLDPLGTEPVSIRFPFGAGEDQRYDTSTKRTMAECRPYRRIRIDISTPGG
ncbi:hypothetical protein GWI33_015523 [Rhynchophorus ferrugineus]|uniref:Uncharacterized protein n=1 Tax=Rhynchophorus ferrugineus TaxID=354439 RepID=A0A834M5X4_RHYFE|nr:hypothetical protein GWI33_015523 [Rhynchophorus ferrugineus]